MLFIKIIMLFIAAILVIVFVRYDPRIDIVKSGNRYSILLWYNEWNELISKARYRCYIELFKF